MSEYTSLDKKYRPHTFEELIGQQTALNTVARMLYSGKLNQTIMLFGEHGTGKTTTARMIARYVNCKKNVGKEGFGEVCGRDEEPCVNCKALNSGSSPNVVEINAAEARGIGEARELIEQARFSPLGAARRVFILDELHQMTSQASQAMLKPLEEPPKKSMWILCTTEPQKILSTIRGRSLQIKLNPVADKHLVQLLTKISKSEGVDLPVNALQAIAEMSQGHVRNGILMLESMLLNVSNVPKEQLTEYINNVLDEMLHRSPEAVVEHYVLALLNNSDEAFTMVRRVESVSYFIKVAVSYLKNLIFALKGLDDLTSRNFKAFISNGSKFKRNFNIIDVTRLYEWHLAAYERSKNYELDALDLMDLVILQCLNYTDALDKRK